MEIRFLYVETHASDPAILKCHYDTKIRHRFICQLYFSKAGQKNIYLGRMEMFTNVDLFIRDHGVLSMGEILYQRLSVRFYNFLHKHKQANKQKKHSTRLLSKKTFPPLSPPN